MKTWICFFLAVLVGGNLFAQNLVEQEVRVPGSIRFENNEGVPDKVETVDQIRGIGVSLGRGPAGPERQYYGRYRALHVVDPSQPDLFDADILSLERTATVDHIRNLRFIVSGFLVAAYGYSAKDADLLAEFVTIYNAVYRKNMEYFASKYKKAVMSRLEANKAGLSTSWRDWPGGTQILLPLSGAEQGSLNTVDTGAISDKNVVEDLRRQEDKGIDSRKDMVDLKERQIEEQQKKVEEQKKQAQEEKTVVAQKERQVQERREQVEEQKKTAVTEEQKQVAAKKEEEVTKDQAKVTEEKKAVEEKEQAIAKEETKIEEKKEEVREDRKEIARDQEEILARDSLAALRGVPFILVGSGAKGSLLLVDPQTGEALGDTPRQPVTIRSYDSFGGGLAAILQRPGSDAGRLCVLDRGTLNEKISAREEVYSESWFQVNGSELFIVIRDQGKWYLGKYDSGLALLARSKTEVNPETFIMFSDAHVFVEDPSGKVVPLSLGDMK
jgi:hypothetical protein